ncbi:phosphoenolpyruvate--protein phosphotransferase [Brachybacterium huguangmaarense]|uniref:Phosphoenolpyruvate-protein phosphotransferase n=1 Tax=Brachybacterium huguangmaarense TaxID=1652028 RepID=A0ABY6G3I7_9MICO|nr:phosphoenolpyruvate--protein phosphotransferase [Brachybacterium huguangmaarense]UYG17366.1 phosphoenolpyruvate--protein phosphotransferase [Brachybacterium huguangmaarense]
MSEYAGVAVSAGRVIGAVRSMAPPVAEPAADAKVAEDADLQQEAARIKDAAAAVQESLTRRAERAEGNAKAVLEATAQMAADPTLVQTAEGLISSTRVTPERAVWDAGDQVAAMLENLGGYMAERAADVKDVRARIVAELRGEQAPGIPDVAEPFVLLAIDLAPADTATLDPAKVIALVTSDGGPQSHTAILARQLGLPAIVAAKGIDAIADGSEVFVDGARGTITDEVGDRERELAAAWAELQKNPLTYSGGGVTLTDGTRMQLLANIGNAKDAEKAAAAHADGVGLFRTEFLFLDREDEPSVAEQQKAYAAVFSHFVGKKVVVRTIDAGADKPLPFLTDADEPNPALGVRAYRTSWEKRSVLTNQLDAIAAAAAESDAKAWVMAPMISTVEDVQDFIGMCRERGISPAGIMVETPSAAVTADRCLAECDFASIGTNDLTQYTMAADRMLGSLAHLNNPWQPAVLSLVGATCTGARAAGGDPEAFGDSANKPVGVCGEAAGDPALAVVLVGLGVNSLSMTPRSLPAVATVLATVSLEEAQRLAQVAVSARTADEGRDAVRAALPIMEQLGL